MTANSETAQAAAFNPEAEWHIARLIYPLYCSLARECVIDVLPCRYLEEETDHPTEDSLGLVRAWLLKMDECVPVHQLRHFLQTSALATGPALQALVLYHLRKHERNDSDRNKIDFLLVQIFSLCVPARLTDRELDLPSVAQILEPVLGQFDLVVPEWLEPLDDLTRKSQSCRTLKELFTSRIIEQGRKLKESSGESYFLPIAMASFTRFGFLLRRTFFRLMHQDLSAILDGLRELEARGVEGLDCRRAQFSAYEPMLRLHMICQSWKVMFHAEYSAGQPLCLLVDLRTVVDAALAKSAPKAKAGRLSTSAKSLATAAGAGFDAGGASRTKVDSEAASTEWDAASSVEIADASSDKS